MTLLTSQLMKLYPQLQFYRLRLRWVWVVAWHHRKGCTSQAAFRAGTHKARQPGGRVSHLGPGDGGEMLGECWETVVS